MEDDYIAIVKDGDVGRPRFLPKNSAFIATMCALLPKILIYTLFIAY
ncbi:hypothetical protein [Mesomycoplasma conjunctivae]